jgi:hypothetical protein
VVASIVAVALEPNQILSGLLHGDDFFNGRPTRYWREVLREEGSRDRISDETIATFKVRESSIPVLATCARDDDPHVREPAVVLLCLVTRLHVHAGLPALRQALQDGDVHVRLHIINFLGIMGANASSAAPDLVSLMKDPEPQVRFCAENALWNASKKLAIEAGGWKRFASARWNFAASFPAPPAEERKPGLFLPDRLSVDFFSARHGVTSCTVGVTEYPAELFKGTDDERLDAGRKLMLFGLDAELLDEKPYKSGLIKGREFTIEKTIVQDGVTNTFLVRSRVFWHERRQYQVVAAYEPNLSILPAVDYFLDSFEFPATGAKTP